MRNLTVWQDKSRETLSFPSLEGRLSADVVVVGAGITGLTTALFLQEMDKKVIVVDSRAIGDNDTGRSTAHLTEILDTRYHELIKHFGMERTRLIHRSHREAIDQIEANLLAYRIQCSFRHVPGFLYAEKENQLDTLEQEKKALAELGVETPLIKHFPLPFSIHGALRIENQAQLDPLQYLQGLARTLNEKGVRIFTHSFVNHIEDGEPCTIKTDRGSVEAESVVVATSTPIVNRVFLHTKVAAYRSYVLAARVAHVPEAPGLFWDVADPYHYLRTCCEENQHVLILGGADHKTGMQPEEDPNDTLSEHLHSHFEVQELLNRWSGQILETPDGLALIGRNSLSKHIFTATGFSGNGITYGTLAARIIAEEIDQKSSRYEPIYRATRTLRPFAIPNYLAENKDFPVCLVKDRLYVGQPIQEIQKGEGAIVDVDGHKAAAYREETGEIKLYSAICPHLGCLVRWNRAEKSFDCPCHGSRFSEKGEIINGPALADLTPMSLHSEKDQAA